MPISRTEKRLALDSLKRVSEKLPGHFCCGQCGRKTPTILLKLSAVADVPFCSFKCKLEYEASSPMTLWDHLLAGET
jgi:transcription elongation factor Elf1